MSLNDHFAALALVSGLALAPLFCAGANAEEPVIFTLDVEVEEISTEDEGFSDSDAPESKGDETEPIVISGGDLARLIHEQLRNNQRSSASILGARQPAADKKDVDEEDPEDLDARDLALMHAGEEIMRQIYLGNWQQLIDSAKSYSNSDMLIGSIVGTLSQGSHLMLADDVMGLAVAIGDSPSPQMLSSLGKLLGVVMERSGERSHFLERLRRGIGPYGGDDSNGRARAAALLLAAGMELEAGPWLPDLGDGSDLQIISLHARHWLARSLDQANANAVLQCFHLEQKILDNFNPTAAEEQRLARASGQRILTLVGAMGEQPGFQQALMQWLGERSLHPAGWQMLRTMVAQRLDSLSNNRAADSRVAVFDLALALAAMEPFPQQDDPFLSAIALNWLREARYARAQAALPEHQRNRRSNELEAIDLQRLAALIPPEAILKLLDPDLGDGLRLESAEQVVARGNFSESLQLVTSLAEGQAERAAHLANQTLRVWVQGFDSGPQRNQDRFYRHYNYYGYYGASPAIPLSRARQERRLEELAGMVQQLESASGQSLDIETVVGAFVACHSPAEIFHRRTMEAVFGDNPSPAQRRHLGNAMRERLAGSWRQPRVQQRAQTQRSDEQLAAEVVRGYELAADLIGEAAEGDWQSLLMAGQISFDHAEFLYGQEAPFAAYAALRESAFDAFAAADTAAAASASGSAQAGRARVEVWSSWFDASLGASDLSYLTRQHEADHGRLRALKDRVEASLSADPQLANLLAQRLHGQLRRVPGQLVHRYLVQACKLLNAVPAADGLRDHLAVLEELLGELALEVTVVAGGESQSVVSDQPFALLISLGHSVDVGREAQNFARYLSNQVYVNGEEVNFRDDFSKHLHDILGQRYEILDLRLYNPGDPSIAHRRPGWRSRPLAWAVLRAHDAAVDRIDPLRLDMDFSHQGSSVILPIASPVVQLQRDNDAGSNSFTDVSISQTLSFHPDEKEVLLLEITADGQGIIPPWDQLLDLSLPGFVQRARRDSGLNLGEMGANGDAAQFATSRRLHLELERLPATAQFTFPSALIDTAELTLQQRSSDGLISSPPSIEIANPQSLITWFAAVVGLLMIILSAAVILRRRSAQVSNHIPLNANPPPSNPTALAAIQWLRQQLALFPQLDAAVREQLQSAITRLQAAHYGRAAGQTDEGPQTASTDPASLCAQCHQLLTQAPK